MVKFNFFGCEAIGSYVSTSSIARILNVANGVLKWNAPNRVSAGDFEGCSMFTNQYITSMGSRSV